jgi:hypothetical protein
MPLTVSAPSFVYRTAGIENGDVAAGQFTPFLGAGTLIVLFLIITSFFGGTSPEIIHKSHSGLLGRSIG